MTTDTSPDFAQRFFDILELINANPEEFQAQAQERGAPSVTSITAAALAGSCAVTDMFSLLETVLLAWEAHAESPTTDFEVAIAEMADDIREALHRARTGEKLHG